MEPETRNTRASALSRLALGTVQFGLPYGVANRDGQPSYEVVRDILACAIEGGVTVLDTAAGYGESEAVLGRALADLGFSEKVTVVTKIAALAPDLSPARADALVEASVNNSLRQLHLDHLDLCLFHREQDFSYADSLIRLRERGLVRRIGSSTTTPTATREIVVSGLAEAVQFPASVLDRRFLPSGAKAHARGMAVFARSVYLQGLLFLDDATTPEDLRGVAPVRRRLAELARHSGMPIAELALRFALGRQEIDAVLVGVDSVAQMRENLALFAKGPLPPDLASEVEAAVPLLPDAILDPWRWAKRMPDAKLKI
jgi:aryl-alcohol dehydrogenase-like predicted oxidoreductase